MGPALWLAATMTIQPDTPPRMPTEIAFHQETLFRSMGRGDNWCITWAADDSQVTSMCDGNWLVGPTSYHNRLYRLRGPADGFEVEELSGYPGFASGTGSWFGYGIVAVGEALYATISKTPLNHWSGPFRGFKLLVSHDGGRRWARVDRQGGERPLAPDDPARNDISPEEMFFFEESPLPHRNQVAWPFCFVAFAQRGRANSAADDDWIYVYSPEGAQSNRLLLARAPQDALGDRNRWEFLSKRDGHIAKWSRSLADRETVHEFPATGADGHHFGWYSWLPSVVYNEPLGLYVMVNGGTYGGSDMSGSDTDYYNGWMHTRSGSLGFWCAIWPWGPWHQVSYTDEWTVDDPNNRTYQPKLSPKWISEDGRRMVLIWSDAMSNAAGKSHTVNYRWNQMVVELRFEDSDGI